MRRTLRVAVILPSRFPADAGLVRGQAFAVAKIETRVQVVLAGRQIRPASVSRIRRGCASRRCQRGVGRLPAPGRLSWPATTWPDAGIHEMGEDGPIVLRRRIHQPVQLQIERPAGDECIAGNTS